MGTEILQRLRSVLIWSVIVIVTACCSATAITLGVLLRPFDPRRTLAHNIGRIWAKLLIASNPMWSVRVLRDYAIPKNTPLIIVANHQGMGDVIALYFLGCHFKWVAKEALFKVPVFGQAMYASGYVPIKRGNKASARLCINNCKEWLAKNMSVFFFPEGTRSPDGQVKAFKDGAFRLALETGIPIVPVTLQGSTELLPKHALVFRNRAQIRIKVGTPIDPKSYSSEQIDDLKEHTRAIISSGLEELRSWRD